MELRLTLLPLESGEEQRWIDTVSKAPEIPDGVTFGSRDVDLGNEDYANLRLIAGIPERERPKLLDAFQRQGGARGLTNVRDTTVLGSPAKAMEIDAGDGVVLTQVVAIDSCSMGVALHTEESTARSVAEKALKE